MSEVLIIIMDDSVIVKRALILGVILTKGDGKSKEKDERTATTTRSKCPFLKKN